MSSTAFYHYLPSGDFVCDADIEYEPKNATDEASIKTLYRLENISDVSILSEEEEVEALTQAMEEIDLGGTPLPDMIWTSIKYKPSQVAQFISLMQNTSMKLPKAAKEAGIEYAMAYKFSKEWKANGGTVLPSYKLASEVKRKGNNIKIMEDHSAVIEEYVEKHPTCIVKDVTEHLRATFEGFTINESSVYRHITDKLDFTLTRTQARLAARNSDDTKEQRRQFVEYLEENKIDYKRQCVFLDESGFKKNLVRPVAWSKKGTPAEVEVQPEGVNLSILGCLSAYGLIAVSQQVPKSSRKKQKVASGTKRGLPHGTNASHFLLFLEEMAAVLNKLGLHNMYIVMDNATIHKTPEVLQAIRNHGHTSLFLPPYSPMLNPIEECWAKIKAEVRKVPLKKNELLADRIEEAAKTVTAKNCRGWIRHSKSFFGKCLDMDDV